MAPPNWTQMGLHSAHRAYIRKIYGKWKRTMASKLAWPKETSQELAKTSLPIPIHTAISFKRHHMAILVPITTFKSLIIRNQFKNYQFSIKNSLIQAWEAKMASERISRRRKITLWTIWATTVAWARQCFSSKRVSRTKRTSATIRTSNRGIPGLQVWACIRKIIRAKCPWISPPRMLQAKSKGISPSNQRNRNKITQLLDFSLLTALR